MFTTTEKRAAIEKRLNDDDDIKMLAQYFLRSLRRKNECDVLSDIQICQVLSIKHELICIRNYLLYSQPEIHGKIASLKAHDARRFI